ncbi:MAG: hypothetical protein KatS3mg108_0233 [Isosphaeraceae bacterium]|jgi:gamma-glutamylcyclotransferase (GGCT)/AIG2-like uncharacterized protein YtfP|nr:MAG: hypothetical protein KatS3mg108_0233 [Isosphaeraceae bacterium]
MLHAVDGLERSWDGGGLGGGSMEGRLEAVGPAYLADHEVVNRSGLGGGGVGWGLRRRVGWLAPARLYRVDEVGRDWLDERWGYPELSRRLKVWALTEDGREHEAFTYSLRAAEVVGAEGAGGEAAGAVTDGLFAYGTLMQGECRHWLVEQLGLIEVVPARVPGILMDLGRYPGLRLAEGASDWVEGELLRLSDPEAALSELDDVEGFKGHGEDGSLYRRALVRAWDRSGAAHLAWVYIYVDDCTGAARIESGNWRRR